MTDPNSLPAQLEEISGMLPEPMAERLLAGIEEIRRSGVAPGLAPGDRAPAFSLPDAHGDPVALDDLLATGPAVVVFYRGAWCPFCSTTLRAYQAALPDLAARDASIVAISPQAPDRALTLSEEATLGFPVLSDVHQRAIRDYRIQFEIPPGMQSLYLDEFRFDPRLQTADGSWHLPIPATFVLDRDRVVLAAHVDADYRTRMDVGSVLDALDAATPGGRPDRRVRHDVGHTAGTGKGAD
jgi:peroxiredoxin